MFALRVKELGYNYKFFCQPLLLIQIRLEESKYMLRSWPKRSGALRVRILRKFRSYQAYYVFRLNVPFT